MKKTTLVVFIVIPVVIGILVATKAAQFKQLIDMGETYQAPPVAVTHGKVEEQVWENRLSTVGSLEAVDGIVVSAELPGKIIEISFSGGSDVATHDLLVKQDVSIETAQLSAAHAALELAKSELRRVQRLIKQSSASQADLDEADYRLKDAQAQVAAINAQIDKKTIAAPFPGRLGVKQVSVGQDLREGQAIVELNKLSPIFVNFYVPQRHLNLIRHQLPVEVALPGDNKSLANQQIVEGKVTAISPAVDVATRNVKVQATIDNVSEALLPGMFVEIDILLPLPHRVLAIPSTAILYAPYGNTVFVIEEGESSKIVRQQIVKTGKVKGDFVEIVSGLKAGETIVTTGAFKLFNGQSVIPDNTNSLEFSLQPDPKNT
ncbi:MAG: efflux RND transporter periplasmic adaptor subunit [Pseudomonadales bacterium]|nr:efflux RND transporter periplasmic adaptor subunit [Pseudomonadales bacterium]